MSPGLQGKTYLVTGCTDGIGENTVHKLAAAGASILLHGRNPQKLATVKQECENRSQGKGSFKTYTCDFSSLEDVRAFADKVKVENESIDVLINNAGIFAKERSLSKDGYELTWAVNILAPVLLTSLLLDKVIQRIVNVGSAAAADSIDLDNLQQETNYDGNAAYAQSKLANLMFTIELAPKMQARGVTVNCIHPGVIGTKVLAAFCGQEGDGQSYAEGADDVFNLSTGRLLGEDTGKFFSGEGLMDYRPSSSLDQTLLHRLFEIMQEQTGARFDC